MSASSNETIAAIGTAAGGGIGIIRLSGPDAHTVASLVFRGRGGRSLAATPPLTLVLGGVFDPLSGEPIDEAFAVLMRAGRSYTGEPSAEIQCHGGRATLEAVLRAVLAAGARPAEPGEFTKRAFLSGRIDLSQAEAVAELVAAQTDAERRRAVSSLQGEVSRRVRALRDRLLELIGVGEALLDHGDEETGAPEPEATAAESLAAAVRELATAGERRERCAHGPSVVIAGRTNSGKSSIFNMLCESERSIVSPHPGTTRDYVAERSFIAGSLVTLIDTAGVRHSEDPVEQEGIRRSRARMRESDILVLVIDGSDGLRDEDLMLIDEYRERRPVVVFSKSDISCRVERAELERAYPEVEFMSVTTREPDGCCGLIAALAVRCLEHEGGAEGAAANLRQREALLSAAIALEESAVLLRHRAPLDLAVTMLHRALSSLGEITGEAAGEQILDRVFSRFCIGK